ncbi:MAG: histidine kinase [Geobacter sp.]|nr:MAG: histidine kinase [Geobacter sp.]
MAGIGFELRKLLKRDSFFAILRTYAYAGIISSGPWVLSIIAVLVIGIISIPVVIPRFLVSQFQTSITYLIALSLIFTGFVQLAFTRYSADRIFDKEHHRLLPNLNGLLLLVTAIGGILAFPLAIVLFPQNTLLFRLLFATTFVVLSCVWVGAILLSGLKAYKSILVNFAVGYGTALILAFFMRVWRLEGLMLAFLIGQFALLLGMLFVLFRNYPARGFIEFDFLGRGRIYLSLVFTGFFYNLGIWADKFVFWFHPYTGTNVIGPLNASEIYDFPVFLAYLSILPGMAVFLVRMETDFVEYYDRFYDAVREGGSLSYIYGMKDEMVRMAREGIYDIIKIQATAAIGVFLVGAKLLELAGIPQVYLPLLYIDVAAAGFQVVFLGVLNIYFYLDRRGRALFLTALFATLNLVFSVISISLGPFFYGYGFALSLCIAIMCGMYLLDYDLQRLEYETFMLQ